MDEWPADRRRPSQETKGTAVTDDIRDALAEQVEQRRSDPEFQETLKRNLDRHQRLLSMLADE